ncbi:hypothetical protein TIFTF001_036056 [Ficus carica]|uniref:Retrotransposon gag domain-containing protein n=2 Tax=Ficus carica TaxID=3494 RepID=A0AA88J774_FICCA|nr:hypothetical protein TIFTF001_036056 [Ficus carica]
MAARHVVLAERKLIVHVYAVDVTAYVGWVVTELVSERVPAFWSHSLPASATVVVPLASRCLVAGARIWWITLGEPAIPRGTWADFCTLIISCYGLFHDEDANMPYRDPDIYRDMYLGRYLKLQALHFLRGGLPPNVRLFILEPMAGMTLEDMMSDIMEAEIIAHTMQVAAMEDDYVVPVDDAGIAEPLFHGGPVMPEDPIPAMPFQKIPPQENPVPPVVPQVQEVHHEIPRNAKVPLPAVGVQVNPPLIREDLLYERFRNVATMSWQDFVTEFRIMYYNREILAAQQDEFNSFRQGSITVMEAIKKFEQLARLCPEHVPNETEMVRRMIKMFRTDIDK